VSDHNQGGVLRLALGAHQLADAVEPGKQALMHKHRSQVDARANALIDSLDFDAALKKASPNAPRWDYLIGVSGPNTTWVVALEVHPVTTHGVADLIAKKNWSRSFLANAKVKIEHWYWVATGPRLGIRRGGSEQRRLVQAGIKFPMHKVFL
jgi:hypothetical protein